MSLATCQRTIERIINFSHLRLPPNIRFHYRARIRTFTTIQHRMDGILSQPLTLSAVISSIDTPTVSINGRARSCIYRQHQPTFGCHLLPLSATYQPSYRRKETRNRCSVAPLHAFCSTSSSEHNPVVLGALFVSFT